MEPIDKTNHKVPKSSESPCNEREDKLAILNWPWQYIFFWGNWIKWNN